ncbi:E3 ubiquitin-protein ligase RBBP6-like [Strix aluco]|uniref:E3 ubiquitin-protein ligase RBBP6-like n=1 Tax=Strix aluco TaxID=111821 RepID=UPI003DA58AEE
MPCVHYKFSSLLHYDTVTFSGLHISLGNLKRQIMGRQKLKVTNCELQITNAQTGEDTELGVEDYVVDVQRLVLAKAQ